MASHPRSVSLGLLPPRTVMAEPGAEQLTQTVLTQQRLKLNSRRRPREALVATATGVGVGRGHPPLFRLNKGEKV